MSSSSASGTIAGADEPQRLFLLDGHSLAYRAFFALPTTLATSTGQITNAVYGFTSMLIKLLTEERPDLIAVAFDRGAPTVRLEKYADYKAGRAETPNEFREQLGLIDEVLETLAVPVIGSDDGHEADDTIGSLALRAVEQGIDVTIVTADRDFFQLVRPGLNVMFNRKGISDIVRYDEAAVDERYGLPPSKYLDFVALKGDPSDNIIGVPGVGDKTASKLIQTFGSVEELAGRTVELKGKQKENVEASLDRLTLNKDLARIVTDLDLELEPGDCRMGEWDLDEVRRLFTSLEFRSLLERLEEIGHGAKPKVEVAELDLRHAGADEVATLLEAMQPKAVKIDGSGPNLLGIAVSVGGGQAAYSAQDDLGRSGAALGDASSAKWLHDAKQAETTILASGGTLGGVAFDTMLAGYLLDPAEGTYPLALMTERYLGTDLLSPIDDDGGPGASGQLFSEDGWRRPAAEAAAIALLAPEMEQRVERAGLRPLLVDVELPLSTVLARMQARGVKLDVPYLEEMAEGVRDRMATLRAEVFEHAGREFNLNSPPQLREVLYDELGLQPGKKTPKGQLSTDASVLEKLRDEHPIVDALLQWRELDKLNSTYLEALPREVDPRDGRVHTIFNQTGAATGRLSSSDPNLQNIPVRSELGRQIRRAFVPGEPGQVLLVADYSQIELRILAHLTGDEGLRSAFESDADIHTATAARVFDLPEDAVDPSLRSRAKMVNYGLAYGMNAWGLASRLGITPDEATEIMDAYFASFPSIKEYLDKQVTRAAADGYTETMLGRRRYIPELQAANPRLRDLGRRMALNAPIQGGASDVFKLAMIRVDRALESRDDLDVRMLLTVHDELVFEVGADEVEEAAALVKREMEAATDLNVPLRADIGWGPTWEEAAPAGH
ncbi:MAG: DNA polymerase I [Actinomycetota bacterium]